MYNEEINKANLCNTIPYNKQSDNSTLVTFMAVGEHGQPYKKPTDSSKLLTFMAVGEHGQPYNRPTNGSSLFCEIAYDEKMDAGDY